MIDDASEIEMTVYQTSAYIQIHASIRRTCKRLEMVVIYCLFWKYYIQYQRKNPQYWVIKGLGHRFSNWYYEIETEYIGLGHWSFYSCLRPLFVHFRNTNRCQKGCYGDVS